MLATLRVTTGDIVPRLRDAAQALGLIEQWTAAIDDRRWWARAEAVRALGLVRNHCSIDRLMLALDEPHEEVRARQRGRWCHHPYRLRPWRSRDIHGPPLAAPFH